LRNATIISDGHDGQSVVKDEYVATSRFAPPPKEKVEAEASNIAVLLIVPEHIYMSEMYHSNDTEHQINNKVRIEIFIIISYISQLKEKIVSVTD